MTEEQEREEVFEKELELQNRIRNLLWTVSGDYTLDMKPDVSLFLRSKAIALYDGVKQGAFARFYDKNLMGMYLVKKIYLGAEEGSLTTLAPVSYTHLPYIFIIFGEIAQLARAYGSYP